MQNVIFRSSSIIYIIIIIYIITLQNALKNLGTRKITYDFVTCKYLAYDAAVLKYRNCGLPSNICYLTNNVLCGISSTSKIAALSTE